MRPGEPREVVAQPRPLAAPAADAEVRVVALREHPAVAAGEDGELDHGGPLEVAAERVEGDVPLEGDAPHDPVAEPGRAGHDAVCAVRADEHARPHRVGADPRGDAGLVELEHLDPRAVPQLRARVGGLLCEERVQVAALRHADQRLAVAAGEARPVAEP